MRTFGAACLIVMGCSGASAAPASDAPADAGVTAPPAEVPGEIQEPSPGATFWKRWLGGGPLARQGVLFFEPCGGTVDASGEDARSSFH